MFGIGKKIAWKAWANFPEVTETFIAITQDPTSLRVDSLHMRRLERLTVLMYSKMCSANSDNEARKLMFTHGLKALDCIPPTQQALFQHTKRVLLVAAFIWKTGSSLSTEVPTFQMQVNGAGNEMPEPRHGCDIGPVYQMPAMDAYCYSTVDAQLHARTTASAIELEFTVGHCASVKEVAQTMIWKPDQY